MSENNQNAKRSADRRAFLKASAAVAAGAALAPSVHAAGNDVLRVGLIGCGGRGTGAARNALKADPNVRLTAMGDAFRDRLTRSLRDIRNTRGIAAAKIDVPADRQFVGFNAYQQVIDSGVDVVLLTTPPHFRPAHLDAAVRAGKHVFAEKPVAVDGPGVRQVIASCQLAQRRGVNIVSGLCWRYDQAMWETIQRIKSGEIGDIVNLQCNYITGTLWHRDRQRTWTDMEFQMRNWLYFTWLSGDFNVEQHVHSLDKMAWIMNDQYPASCYGMGGRIHRTDPKFGHIFDHMSCVYEYANGVKVFSLCRQMDTRFREVKDYAFGTNGSASLMDFRLTGPNSWRYSRRQRMQDASMYQLEHNRLFSAIRNGQTINNGDYMAKSSLMGIMGRMACYTGERITWQNALNSTVRLGPTRYQWGRLETPAIARPGRRSS